MKTLLIADVAAKFTSVAMADISISGSGGDYTMKADVTLTGKSGDTSVVAKIGLDAGNAVEQLYATSSVAGIKVKAGTWKSGKGELGQNAAGLARVAASTSFGGVKLSYSDRTGAGGTDTTISGTIAGVKISRKLATGATFEATYTETEASGTMGGVSFSAHALS
jgi:hypothetical protein